MADELVHSTVGTTMTQAEFEAVGLHLCNNQVTGDLIYASSSSQLSRLGIGSAGTILTSNGSTPSWSSLVFINDSANTFMTTGLTINQGAADNELLSGKSSDVNHSFTDLTEADTWLIIKKSEATSGGAWIRGYKSSAGGAAYGLILDGAVGETVDTTKSTAGLGAVEIRGWKNSGAGAVALGANENVLVIQSGSSTVSIFDTEGDLWMNGNITTVGGTPSATGHIFGARYLELTEMAAPGVGAADTARIYIKDNGAGKTQIMAQFATGAEQQIAIEP